MEGILLPRPSVVDSGVFGGVGIGLKQSRAEQIRFVFSNSVTWSRGSLRGEPSPAMRGCAIAQKHPKAVFLNPCPTGTNTYSW